MRKGVCCIKLQLNTQTCLDSRHFGFGFGYGFVVVGRSWHLSRDLEVELNLWLGTTWANRNLHARQVSRSSAGHYQADEQAGVARLRWRVSCR